ncbi:hypothetical protein AVEN_176455-1, partial [Araneus ventricosus]
KEWLNTIINERKEREGNEIRKDEIAEQERKEKIDEQKRQEEIAEQRHQEETELRKHEYEERKRKEEQEYQERKRKEEQEYEERKRKDEMEFELQKIRLGAEGRSSNSNSVVNQNVNNTKIKPKLEIHHLMQKFTADQKDISLYLIMFERLSKQAEILENT